ncbi:hypothetical protein BCU00_019660 [Vibrio breoganii]|uniref:hypothetical protein n=1 Tax=Vibrio breoganii TaxID=553239 RepID=UPI0039A5E4CC
MGDFVKTPDKSVAMILEIMLNALVVISLFTGKGAGFGFWKRGHSRYRSEQGCGRERTVLITARNMKYAATLNNKSLQPYLVVVVIRFQAVTASKTPCVGPLIAIY